MYKKNLKLVRKLNRTQHGITGLETAIILIAFVTVASVLAYSVLSAGIYASERGSAAIHNGLISAQSTMSLKGAMVGAANDPVTPTHLATVTFHLALAIPGDSVDLNNCIINYWDETTGVSSLTLDASASGTNTPTTVAGDWSYYIGTSDTSILSGAAEALITVALPDTTNVSSYNTFTIEINPPTGASLTLQRTLGPIAAIMTLN